jgi:hypothetical protein
MIKYSDIKTRETGPAEDYFLNCLLRARIDTRHETANDEDVNMYLAGLLCSLIRSGFWQSMAEYVSKYDSEIAERVKEHHDHVYSYHIYKANADFYLLSLSLFGGLQSPHVPALFQITPENFRDRASAYYRFAATLNGEVFHKVTAVAQILGKLAAHFDTYRDILAHAKEKFFDLEKHFQFSAGEWFHFEREINQSADKELLKKKMDLLLDLYGQYLKDKNGECRQKLLTLAAEIKAFDPEFKFEI